MSFIILDFANIFTKYLIFYINLLINIFLSSTHYMMTNLTIVRSKISCFGVLAYLDKTTYDEAKWCK